jgi:hypothetical protein
MDEYLARARRALGAVDEAAASLVVALGALPPPPALPSKKLDTLKKIAERLPGDTRKVRSSLDLTEKTAVDIVDLQDRLEGECAALAADLAALGDELEKAPETAAALASSVVALEERAERLASAIFPNAIEGLRAINRTLWEFRLIAKEYSRTFADEVARAGKKRLTPAQLDAVRGTADQLTKRFDDVNGVLNALAISTLDDSRAVMSVIRQARRALGEAVKDARKRATPPFKPFHGVLGDAEKLARKIDGQFADLRVPVFPSGDGLSELETAIDSSLYTEIAGVERMALLNISARLRSIPFGPGAGDHLLSPRFNIRVFEVFPDRIYFTADEALITSIAALVQQGVFEKAPASLHRFNEGSFKQKVSMKGKQWVSSRKGNLQVSFAKVKSSSGDTHRVNVDADIDLYRGTLRHLFGEVLVNHLTGNTTDQFKVWDILAGVDVEPIGDFDVVTV